MTTFNVLGKLSSVAVLKNTAIKEFLAEMLGTFLLVFMGNGAVAQTVMSGGDRGDFFSINVGYAVAVFLGVMASGGVSGGHINPAVSVSLAVFGKFSWAKVPIYLVAQYMGAFTGSLMLFLVYRNALDAYDPQRTLASAGIFATYPGSVINGTGDHVNFLTSGNGLGDQIMGTLVLLLCVCAITDPRNMAITKPQIPAAVATVVFGIGLSLGLNCGYAINPARDLGPRLFTLVAGWGAETFKSGTVDGVAWWWVPVLGTHLGGILGTGLYCLLVELHHEDEDEQRELDLAGKAGELEASISLLPTSVSATYTKQHSAAAEALNSK